MTTTDDQLSAISAQLTGFLATLDNSVNWQVQFLAGSTDDPASFDKDGGKTGALGYYPVVNVSGQTVYMPSLARMKTIALGGANAETLDLILGTANSKIALVDQATQQANAARDAAATQAGYAGQQGDYAKQQAAAIGDIGGAVATATAARADAVAAAGSVNAARPGMGEQIRNSIGYVAVQAGAAKISSGGIDVGFSIPANASGALSSAVPTIVIPPEISARFAGVTLRIKTVSAVTANFIAEKPLTANKALIYLTDGTHPEAGTVVRSEQIGTNLYREVTYTLTGVESAIGLILQVTAANNTNAHSLQVTSLSAVVEAVPANAAYTGADVVAAWRAYEQRVGIGDVYGPALGLTVTSANGGTAFSAPNGKATGITTASGLTGQNAAAGMVIPIDAVTAPSLSGKALRFALLISTSATFTRTFNPSLRTRNGVTFTATIAGNQMTLTSGALNAVTGLAASIPLGQPLYLSTATGTAIAFVQALASGANGAAGSVYTLNTASLAFASATAFTMYAYRFLNVVVELDTKISPTQRLLTFAVGAGYSMVGDEAFVEPYVAQTSAVQTGSVETWYIADLQASISVVGANGLGPTAASAVVAQTPQQASVQIAALRASASARALAAADAQTAYLFGPGDMLPLANRADQAGAYGAVAAGNTITVPAGQTGQNAIFQRKWTFSGASNVGKTVRIKLPLTASATFTRALTCSMQVAVAAAPGYATRTATVTSVVSGTSRIYTVEYVVQGDEVALQPYVIFGAGAATATAETLTLNAMLIYFLSTNAPGKSPADENIAQLIASILAQAALAAQSSNSYAVTKTVKADGTGDFTHPKLALDAINDASITKRYCIAIYPGNYTGYAEWHTKDFVDLIGIGRREEIIISYALPNDASAATISTTSTMWWDTFTKLANLTVTITNGRYAVHCETNGLKPGITQWAENCVFIHYGNDNAVNNTWDQGSQIAVGSGISDGQTIVLRGCRGYGPGGGFSYHTPNGGSRTLPTFVDVEGCEFASTKPYRPSFTIHNLGPSVGDKCRLAGNSFNGDIAYDANPWLNANDNTSNRAAISVYGSGNTAVVFNNAIGAFPGTTYRGAFADEEKLFINSGAVAISQGSVVASYGDNNDEKRARLMTSADAAGAFAGVALEDIAVGAMGRIKVRGRVLLTDLVRSDAGAPNLGNTFSIDPANPGKVMLGGTQGLLATARYNVAKIAA